MTIRKTTSTRAKGVAVPTSISTAAAAPPATAMRIHRLHAHYAHHNVVVVASPSRRATLLQRQVARTLDAIDMDDDDDADRATEAGDASDALYASPNLSVAKKTLPVTASAASGALASPSAGFQISPNAVKRKRSHSVSSSASSASSGGPSAVVANSGAASPPSGGGLHSELRVDIESIDKEASPLSRVVAKRAIKGGVTPSKRCKDKKKKQKVDVIERAIKRFRADLRQGDDGSSESERRCFEFMSVCHRDDDAGDAGLTTPRHASGGSLLPSDDCNATDMYTSTMSSNRPIERGSSRRSEGVAQPMRVQVGVAAAQGTRAYMEDRFSVTARLFEHHEQRDDVKSHASLLAVYDGHNGALAAEYAATRFRELLADNEFLLDLCKRPVYVALSDDDIERVENVLKDTFEVVDDEILEFTMSQGKRDGSTVLLGLLIGGKLFVANLGDTRGVLGTATDSIGDGNDDVVRVSVDHKPDLKTETARVEEAGGKVIFSGCWRVAHDEVPLRLAVSRSLGDHPLKANLPLSCSAPLVSVVPDIQVLDISGSSDDVLVFATDGLWDRLSDDDAIRIARTKITEYASQPPAQSPAKNAMQSAAIALVETALVKRSMDNITAMVISFSSESAPRLDDIETRGGDDDDDELADL